MKRPDVPVPSVSCTIPVWGIVQVPATSEPAGTMVVAGPPTEPWTLPTVVIVRLELGTTSNSQATSFTGTVLLFTNVIVQTPFAKEQCAAGWADIGNVMGVKPPRFESRPVGNTDNEIKPIPRAATKAMVVVRPISLLNSANFVLASLGVPTT